MDSESPNKEQIIELLAASVKSGSEQCCYRTCDVIQKGTDPKLRLPKPVKLPNYQNIKRKKTREW